MSPAPVPRADGAALTALVPVMRRLRAECPWKSAQTHRTLARHLLEETHEVLEALDTGDTALLREELGDLLLQVYFHAAIAEERGEFDVDDVAADLHAKLVRRNPHVLGEGASSAPGAAGDTAGPVPDAATVNETWEAVKATEKRRTSPVDGLPATLPALLWADKVLDRAERAGTPLATPDPTAAAADLGDRLLALVAEARASGTDPEQALRDAVRRRL
ncbi:MazG family protein [Nocardioides sp. ChNu-153]|uniref:MazG family protein n=1 Tax=unclassified Nocardioides TaxID=2615069 RepID=UPI002405E3F0|nr:MULTISPECIES: MazG family protein [unclassified Nocardioides]MDN7120521.1 MazG family protein [Nocardioides sp. ChNu-153]